MKVREIMTPDPEVERIDSRISEAIHRMRESDIEQLPVLDGKNYVGMITYRDILRRRSVHMDAKVEGYIVKTPVLSPEDDVLHAVDVLRDSGLPALPVVDKHELVGIVSRTDIMKHIGEVMPADRVRVLDLMATDPVTVTEKDDVSIAAERIRQLEESEIPVVSSKDGRLVGILRMDEIAANTVLRDKQRMGKGDYAGVKEKVEISCGSLMDNPVSVSQNDTVAKACALMVGNRLHILPVVDGSGLVVGIIGVSDVIDAIDTKKEKEGLTLEVSGLSSGDQDLYDATYFLVGKAAQRLLKMAHRNSGVLKIHVQRYESGGRVKYSLRTRLVSGPINITVNDYGWDYARCLSHILEVYEGRLEKLRER
ncbi:CBS domain-containing protein [Thermogymnomonas acidicola]|nr:CBS domain-containing protein [Thermogymnomonas acidicola]